MTDRARVEALLVHVWKMNETLGGDPEDPLYTLPELGEAILVGDFFQARAWLDLFWTALHGDEERTLLREAVEVLRSGLPDRRDPDAAARQSALDDVLHGFESEDPFEIQKKLSFVTAGLSLRALPEDLREIQISLTERASHLARRRALDRPAPGESVRVQDLEDCWVQALYHLPIPHLHALRSAMNYDAFLGRVQAKFPESDFEAKGMTLPEYRLLLESLGLASTSVSPTDAELAALVGRHGGVLGAIGWFDRDVYGVGALESMRYWRQHAVAIVGVAPESGLFEIRDSLVPNRIRCTMEELDVMSLVVFVVEPAAGRDAALGRFLSE